MKLVYSELKKLLPSLVADPLQLREDLTLIGHFVSGYEKVDDEDVFDLEIRQNRADCLGYYGLARDLATYYSIKLSLPQSSSGLKTDNQNILPITIKSTDVKRLMAVKISGLSISESPLWLKKLLLLHGINSINNLVDLTNYLMLLYGIPCHAFDVAKTSESLIWENNHGRFSRFTTLDGTTLSLTADNLIVSNEKEALSLGFIGGNNSGINFDTKDSILEMAIYTPQRIRSDSRGLKTITEASLRLDKYLDPDTIPLAFNHLIRQVLYYCQGSLDSQIFEFYPQISARPIINFNLNQPNIVSGITIPETFSVDCLKQLGCQLQSTSNPKIYLVTPPSIRVDLNIEADLVEEVVRFWGYQKIPTNLPIYSDKLTDITPPIIYLQEKAKDALVKLGYDEVRSWPLTNQPTDSSTVIATQNSINSDYPYLRQSIIQSLQSQLFQFQRYNLPNPQFFEVGKIYSQTKSNISEHFSLGFYHPNIDDLKHDLDRLVKTLQLPPSAATIKDNYAEIILDSVPVNCPEYQPNNVPNHAVELTRQIITLDANIISPVKIDPTTLINQYQNNLKDILWQIIITDIYHDLKTKQYRYTLRVAYYNCDDKTAKAAHLLAFNLSEIQTTSSLNLPTKLLYYDDMYLSKTSAKVINLKKSDNGLDVILDQTIFFPEGGGQPADIGTIDNFPVQSLAYKNGQVIHYLENCQLQLGQQVYLTINWDHRYRFMKVHSAGHLIHEVVMTQNSSLIPIKGDHGQDPCLLYTGILDPSLKTRLENEVNQQILNNLPIVCDYATLDELKRDARSVPPNLPLGKKLRRLKIGSYPSMADGGIQVKSTKEIGQVNITSIEVANNQTKISYQVIQ